MGGRGRGETLFPGAQLPPLPASLLFRHVGKGGQEHSPPLSGHCWPRIPQLVCLCMSGALCHLLSDLVEELIIGIHVSISGALLKSAVGELILARLQWGFGQCQEGFSCVWVGIALCVCRPCSEPWGNCLSPLDLLFLPGSLGCCCQPGCSALRVLHLH